MIQLGTVVNSRYEIVEKIGTGGMSTVYKATDLKLSRFVAVKVLKDEFSYDEEFVKKFKVEAQAAASLSHSNIVNIYDVGNDGNHHYIVMEYLDGMTLKEYIKSHGSLTNEETMRIGACMASALDCAHNNHIIHRDIKPQNIMMTKDGRAKVTDFGIARVATGATIPATDMASGSVHYIPPEQAKSGYSNEQSDIYSLGITMYEMITGQVPFEADSAVAVALKQIHDDLPNIKDNNKEVDNNLEQIIRKATMKKSEQRYRSASQMLQDLRRANNFPDESFVSIDSIDVNAHTMVMDESQMRQIWDDSDEVAPLDSNSKRTAIIGGIVAAVVAVALLVSVLFNLFYDQIVPQKINVPDVVGLSLDEAGSVLGVLELSYQIEETRYDDAYPKDVIIDQFPEVSTEVAESTTIYVVVSQGKQLYMTPDVTGLTYKVAEELVKNSNLTAVIDRQYDNIVPVGSVIGQYPEASTQLEKGAEVTIIVSLGKEDRYVEVPDVRGLSFEEASSQLRIAGLTVGDGLTESYNDIIPEGSVIALTVVPGTEVKEGYVIDMTISLGKEIKEVTKTIIVNDILGPSESTVSLKVALVREDDTTEIVYEGLVGHEDFDPQILIPVTGLGRAVYEVYKDNVLEYKDNVVFTEENGQ